MTPGLQSRKWIGGGESWRRNAQSRCFATSPRLRVISFRHRASDRSKTAQPFVDFLTTSVAALEAEAAGYCGRRSRLSSCGRAFLGIGKRCWGIWRGGRGRPSAPCFRASWRGWARRGPRGWGRRWRPCRSRCSCGRVIAVPRYSPAGGQLVARFGRRLGGA
jgi:hypothetical protein